MEKRLIAALVAALAGALLVIAFLVGRVTGRASAPMAAAPVIVRRETPHDPFPSAAQPPVAAQNEEQPGAPVREMQPPPHQEPASVREPSSVPRPSGDAAAIASYFAKIDAIHVAGTGDPTAVAQGILGGIEHGDSSGIDSLVDSAKLALAQATEVQPPASCADYHRRLLGVLSEATVGMTRMREAMAKGDVNGITELVPQLQATQHEIEELDRMRKQLLGQ